jgi:hypothetical protein
MKELASLNAFSQKVILPSGYGAICACAPTLSLTKQCLYDTFQVGIPPKGGGYLLRVLVGADCVWLHLFDPSARSARA